MLSYLPRDNEPIYFVSYLGVEVDKGGWALYLFPPDSRDGPRCIPLTLPHIVMGSMTYRYISEVAYCTLLLLPMLPDYVRKTEYRRNALTRGAVAGGNSRRHGRWVATKGIGGISKYPK